MIKSYFHRNRKGAFCDATDWDLKAHLNRVLEVIEELNRTLVPFLAIPGADEAEERHMDTSHNVIGRCVDIALLSRSLNQISVVDVDERHTFLHPPFTSPITNPSEMSRNRKHAAFVPSGSSTFQMTWHWASLKPLFIETFQFGTIS
jgi:hypothetical protein